MNRGERISNKTKSAIKKALLELMREKNYPDITVREVAERGNVGRSTLYKHYPSKASVLVDIHKDIFEHLFSGLSTLDSWLAPQPPAELVSFFEESRNLGRNPFTLSYKLGSDLDYLINNINLQLTSTIEEKLGNLGIHEDSKFPLPMLAQSISSLYSGLMMSWFAKFQSSDIPQFATNMHRMIKALIFEAMGKNAT